MSKKFKLDIGFLPGCRGKALGSDNSQRKTSANDIAVVTDCSIQTKTKYTTSNCAAVYAL